MTPPATLFHALLRPSVLQILRATGYHCTRPAVLDSLTDLAANYLLALCRAAAQHTTDDVAPGLAEIRMALEDVGAIAPEDDDVQAVQDFVDWFAGARNAEIRRIVADGDAEAPADWLTALKQKHSKTGDDSKFQGTLLGKPNEHGEVLVEGGNFDTIQSWSEHRKKSNVITPPPSPPQHDSGSRPSSSGLSSLGDGDMDFEMGGSNATPAGDTASGAMAVDP
ncbi:hypothetical protein PspLS_04471 [Pyricularia sp. CBS 133598]|nr:hypothetical protein PspLS_04471 [Pyricularia sp. CBS 133598]